MSYLHLFPPWMPRLARLPHWSLQALQRQRAQRRMDRALAASEACASEGAEVELRLVELDGQCYGALYRNGELVCLLPRDQER